jgi:hypothetical protein
MAADDADARWQVVVAAGEQRRRRPRGRLQLEARRPARHHAGEERIGRDQPRHAAEARGKLAGEPRQVEQRLARRIDRRLVDAQEDLLRPYPAGAGQALEQRADMVGQGQRRLDALVRIEPARAAGGEQVLQGGRHPRRRCGGRAALGQEPDPVPGLGGRFQQRREAAAIGPREARIGEDDEIEGQHGASDEP